MKKYVFTIGENGKAHTGTVLEYPDEYQYDGSEDVWNAMERSFYDKESGKWTVYDPLTIAGPSEAVVGDVISVTVTLPDESPDSEVTFSIRLDDGESTELGSVSATDGTAEMKISLDSAGSYTVFTTSEHHGWANMGVAVNERTTNEE